MLSDSEKGRYRIHFKCFGPATIVSIVEGIVAGLTTSGTRFSPAEAAFAFILTYTIALGILSRRPAA